MRRNTQNSLFPCYFSTFYFYLCPHNIHLYCTSMAGIHTHIYNIIYYNIYNNIIILYIIYNDIHISSPLHVEGSHATSLKPAMVRRLAPWKSANATNQGFLCFREMVVEYLLAYLWMAGKVKCHCQISQWKNEVL